MLAAHNFFTTLRISPAELFLALNIVGMPEIESGLQAPHACVLPLYDIPLLRCIISASLLECNSEFYFTWVSASTADPPRWRAIPGIPTMNKSKKYTLAERKRRAEVIHKELENLFPGNLATPLNFKTPFQLLVAVILSAQCTDDRVNIVTKQLFKKYKDAKAFANANINELEKLIYSTGFYHAKAKAVIGSAQIIELEYKGKLPATMQELLQLPGVGRKTANVILGHIFDTVEGIAVDTHVRRLAKKFGLTTETDPDRIEKDLCEILPQKHWWNFSYRLKAYGRAYSRAHQKELDTDPISKKLLHKK